MSPRPSRQAAQTAGKKIESQLMSSPVKPEDGRALKKARSRPHLKQVSSGSSKRSATAPRPAVQTRPPSRKRPLSPDSRKSSEAEDSDLTSLSTRTESPSPRSKPILLAQKSLEPDNPLQAYVWVLVNFRGEVFCLGDEGDEVERVWWPAMEVESKGSTRHVRLFGRIGDLESGSVVEVTTHKRNILPYCREGDAIRYTAPHYFTSFSDKDTHSPKKRQKLDRSSIESQWHVALSQFVKAIEEELPSISFVSSVSGIKTQDRPNQDAQAKAKGPKGKNKAQVEDELPDDSRWSPPPSDPALSVPGELLLAHDKGRYWPAQIISYVPPETSKDPPRYRIRWMDDSDSRPSKATLERSSFYVYEDPEFGTCTLGKFQSVFEEVVSDDADAPPDAPPDGRLSPEPRYPPPSAEDFADLDLHEQFAYTKPVLQAILLDQYPPAQTAHAKFIGGGQGRNAVAKEAGQRGLLDPSDVEQFQKLLTEWCLRETQRKGPRAEDADVAEVAVEEVVAPTADDTAAAAKDDPEQLGVAVEKENVVSQTEEDVLAKDAELKSEGDLQNLASDNTAAAATDGSLQDEQEYVEVAEDPALLETLCSPPSPTATAIDERASSPALPPPSSSFSPDTDVAMDEDTEVPSVAPADVDEDTPNVFDTSSMLSEASDVSDLVPPTKPPRQIGCEAYEGLSTIEKMDYCLNVLLPELLIQILLWRTGKRSSVALLPVDEEQTLHALGLEEKSKTDWVFDVKRLRAQKERELLRNTQTVVVGGTASRPKRITAPVRAGASRRGRNN